MGFCQYNKNKKFEELTEQERIKLLYRSLEYLAVYRSLQAEKNYLLEGKRENNVDEVINFLFNQLDQARLYPANQWKNQIAVNAANTLLNWFSKQGNASTDRITFVLPTKTKKEAKKNDKG